MSTLSHVFRWLMTPVICLVAASLAMAIGWLIFFVPAFHVFDVEFGAAAWLWKPPTAPLVTGSAVIAAWMVAPSNRVAAGVVALLIGIAWSSLFLWSSAVGNFHLPTLLMGIFGIAGGMITLWVLVRMSRRGR